jgi:hypothetical protein
MYLSYYIFDYEHDSTIKSISTETNVPTIVPTDVTSTSPEPVHETTSTIDPVPENTTYVPPPVTPDTTIDNNSDDSSNDSSMSETQYEQEEESQEETKEEKEEPINVKRIYEKYEDIKLPSSISAETGGYISPHQICFRKRMNDTEFVSKRPGCMACQVDKRPNGNKNYDGTQTNIAVTCPYSLDDSDPNIFNKAKCTALCSTINDLQ